MMDTMYAVVPSIASLPQCWLYINQTYIHMDGIQNERRLELPIVSGAHTPILDILKIPYRKKSDNVFEMWNPSCFDLIDTRLPLYIQQGNKYRYIKKHSGKIASPQTRQLAFELYESTVKPAIDKHRRLEKNKKLFTHFSDIMGDSLACGVKYTDSDLLTDCYKNMDIKMSGKHFRIFPVYVLLSEEKQAKIRAELEDKGGDPNKIDFYRATNYIAVFETSQLFIGSTVEMKVPAGTEALFIGRGGWQVKDWGFELGLSKINVKSF